MATQSNSALGVEVIRKEKQIINVCGLVAYMRSERWTENPEDEGSTPS